MQPPDPRFFDFPDIDRFGSHLPPADDASLARLLRLIAKILAGLLFIFLLASVIGGRHRELPVIALGIACLALLGRGTPPLDNTRLATLLAFGLAAMVSVTVLLSDDGIRNPAVMAYPGILLLASLTVSSIQFVAVAIAICTTAVGLGMLELHQIRAVTFGPPLERRYLLDLLLILTGTAIVARLLAHHLLSHLHRAHWQSLIDPLTGLPNRRALNARADSFLAEARQAGLPTMVIALHVDRLDRLNNVFGYALGDGALLGLGRHLRALVNADCLVARRGDSTFVVMLRSRAEHADATSIARHLLTLTRKEQRVGSVTIRLDGTCGLCSTAGALSDGETATSTSANELIEEAFIALDIALKNGGGQVQAYAQEFGEQVRGDFLIESTLRAAIDLGRVEMHYQPILSQPDGRVIAMEALLRLRSASGEPLSALPAIELAEASGLIHRLGDVILDSVLKDVSRWRADGQSQLPVSVNFSGLQMSRPDFAETLLEHLRQYDLPGQALILEITETAAISGDARLGETLTALSRAGVLIALDDFGAGHSSLHRLQEIPADIIKFDRSLIERIGDSESARAFLRKTVELVQVTHPFILFEGIEDSNQVGHIPGMGCHAVQGYWYARPVPADAVPAFLASQELGTDLQQRPGYPAEAQ